MAAADPPLPIATVEKGFIWSGITFAQAFSKKNGLCKISGPFFELVQVSWYSLTALGQVCFDTLACSSKGADVVHADLRDAYIPCSFNEWLCFDSTHFPPSSKHRAWLCPASCQIPPI
jgi:hypothetical protein